MTDQGDDATDERRLFEESTAGTVAFVASELGIARVDVAGDRVGQFSLAKRCTATAIAAAGDVVAVGTDEDVLVSTGGEFVATGFGPAAAVGVDDDTLVAATPDGQVGRLTGHPFDAQQWESAGQVTAPRRFDGTVLAAGSGVFRVTDSVDALGLDDAFDVAGGHAGADVGPFAATGTGLFRLDDDWIRELDGAVQAVDTDGERVRAVDDEAVLERALTDQSSDSDWQRRPLPEGVSLVDIAHGETLYGVTSDGQFLVSTASELTTDDQSGWRSQHVGIRGVVGLAVLAGD